MKNIILLLILIFLSCNSKKENNEKYFEYDEIEYYKSEIEEEQMGELYGNKKLSVEDSIKKGVILGEIPQSITDTNFINNLESYGYKKSKIDSIKFDKINEVFIEKINSDYYETACVYIFRDILIFKRKSKIVGIAKICFGCDANVIVGTNSNTIGFGMNEDYEKLRKILNKN
jgi:hypothetical protein